MPTPFEISIALHYHTTPGDFRNGDFSAPILPEIMECFVRAGLLRDNGEGDGVKAPGQRYQATDGLSAYVDALCNLPFPVQRWVMPDDSHARRGRIGGLARADALTPERRSEIAQHAANARWNAESS